MRIQDPNLSYVYMGLVPRRPNPDGLSFDFARAAWDRAVDDVTVKPDWVEEAEITQENSIRVSEMPSGGIEIRLGETPEVSTFPGIIAAFSALFPAISFHDSLVRALEETGRRAEVTVGSEKNYRAGPQP